jgi:hypothetical protein
MSEEKEERPPEEEAEVSEEAEAPGDLFLGAMPRHEGWAQRNSALGRAGPPGPARRRSMFDHGLQQLAGPAGELPDRGLLSPKRRRRRRRRAAEDKPQDDGS